MNADGRNPFVSAYQTSSKIAAAWSLTVGLIVLAGWLFKAPILRSLLPGAASTKPNTAIAFIITGAVIWLLPVSSAQRRQVVLRRILMGLLALLALLTLAEYVLRIDLGIDQLLFSEPGATRFPGRMAPITALNFLLLAEACVLEDVYSRHRLAQTLALVTTFFGLLAFLGYLFGESSLYQIADFTAIALPTAMTFVASGLGILVARPNRGWMAILTSDSAGGKLARRLVPATLILPIVIGWLRLVGERLGLYDAGFGLAMFTVANIVIFTILIASGASSLVDADLARREAELKIRGLNAELEARVVERTSALLAANQQLTNEISERKEIEAALARESDLLQALMDNIPDTIYFKDLASRFTRINQAQARVLGVAQPEDALGKTDADFQSPDLAVAFSDEEKNLLTVGVPVLNRPEYNPTPDGQPRWFAATKMPMRDRDGKIVGLVGISHNITERMQSDEALRQANSQLTERIRQMSVLNELAEQLQACLTLVEVFQVTGQMVGRLFPQTCGALYVSNNSRNWIETAAAWGSPRLEPQVLEPDDCWALRRGRTHVVAASQGATLPCRHLLDSRPALSVCIPLLAHGDTLGIWHLRAPDEAIAGSFDDVVLQLARVVADSVALAIANLNLRETLKQQSIRDPLTDLFNRRYMEESLERELLRAARTQRPVGVVMLDVDHFKDINDLYGHGMGDAVLRQLGQFLKENTRGGDIASRYGGEEFTIILPNSALDQTENWAEKHRLSFKNVALEHRDISLASVTLSFGVAAYPQHGQTGEQVLRAADAALYRAKHSGRDQVQAAA